MLPQTLINENDGKTEEATERPFVKRRNLAAPWKNVAEFRQTYEWLYADSATIETQSRALRKIHTWSLRRRTFCPAAILATAVIVRVQLQDKACVDNLQTLYSSAFTRFFNFMSSIMQSHNMRTMYETANNLGLHSFVVDIRHICAHGQELPPLGELRSTAKYCLDWLHDFYWREQLQSVCDVNATHLKEKLGTQFHRGIKKLFEIYDTALMCYMMGAQSLSGCKRFAPAKCYAQFKQFNFEHNIKELSQVFSTVVKQLSSMIKHEVANKEMTNVFIESMLQMKYFFSMAYTNSSGEPLQKLINVTQELFRMLAQHDLIEGVFYTLLHIAEDSSIKVAKRHCASFWAMHISDSFVALRKMKRMYKEELDQNPKYNKLDFSKLNTEKLPTTLRMLLVHSSVNQNCSLVFGDATRRARAWVFEREILNERLKAIDEFSLRILKNLLLLIEPALSDPELEDLYEVLESYFQSFDSLDEIKKTTKSKGDCIYTAEDLLANIENQAKVQSLDSTKNATKFGAWNIVSDTEANSWAQSPLGVLPWE